MKLSTVAIIGGAFLVGMFLRKSKAPAGAFLEDGTVNPDYSDFIFTPPTVQLLPTNVVQYDNGWGQDPVTQQLYIPINGGVDGYKIYNWDELIASLREGMPNFNFIR